MRIAAAAIAASLVMAAPAAATDYKGWSTASDVSTGILVVAALGNPLLVGDSKGFWQAAGSVGAGAALSEGLSAIVKEDRPDHSGDDSFPSSHAAVAFAAAGTLWRRSGWQVGLPAEALAIFTGVARVEAKKHHWYDVVAGAAIGTVPAFLITKPINDGAQLSPWADAHGAGITYAMRF